MATRKLASVGEVCRRCSLSCSASSCPSRRHPFRGIPAGVGDDDGGNDRFLLIMALPSRLTALLSIYRQGR